jgi:hypothetical protein
MVLVAGLLALLVIIGAVALATARSSRAVASSMRDASAQRRSAEDVARFLAGEVAAALFADEAGPDVSGAGASAAPSANAPRRPPALDALPYGHDPAYPFRFRPHHVVPYTNPPDAPIGGGAWPRGEGAPNGVVIPGEANPLGNPGDGDARWLRDLEPVRGDLDGDGRPDSLLLWRHLSYVPRAANAVRAVRDLADVTDADGDGTGGVALDLDVPVEQWLVADAFLPDPSRYDRATGDATVPEDFIALWQAWLGAPYEQAYADPSRVPVNLFDLKQLGPPADERAPGTMRWLVTRVLADSDGDGVTDSLWFLLPGDDDGVKRVLAVSITDNCGRLNANLLTAFQPGGARATAGETPADLAGVGEGRAWDHGGPPPSSWNVGYYDNHHHAEGAFDLTPALALLGGHPLYDGASGALEVRYDAARYGDFLEILGARGADGAPSLAFPDELRAARERRLLLGAVSGRLDAGALGLSRFGAADEIELRLHHGQNHSWAFTRLERAVNLERGPGSAAFAFLRSPRRFAETAESRRQLTLPELLHDRRRMLTALNGARNDLLPPWLRWRWRDDLATAPREDLPEPVRAEAAADPSDVDSDGVADVEERFLAQALRKLDLREPPRAPDHFHGDGRRLFHERLTWVLLHALADGTWRGGRWHGCGGDAALSPASADDLRRMAAGYAANLLAYRDADDAAPLADDPATDASDGAAVALPELDGLPRDDRRVMLGLERQPFITEAFVAHAYAPTGTIPRGSDPPYHDEGDRYVAAGMPQTTIVVVQIANPFVRAPEDPRGAALDLSSYVLRAFGRDVRLQGSLPPATEEWPVTATFHSIQASFAGDDRFTEKWLDFLDLEPNALAPGSIVTDVAALGGAWPRTRAEVDPFAGDHPVELVRVDPVTGAGVVVDRIDRPAHVPEDVPHARFGAMLAALPEPPVAGGAAPVWEGIRLRGADLWVAWARVARAWGSDVDFIAGAAPTYGVQGRERAPRFVFARQVAHASDQEQHGDPALGSRFRGSTVALAQDPDAPWFDRVHESAPWRDALGLLDFPRRKPTFFNVHPVYAAGGADVYPAFDDPVFGYGRYFYGATCALGDAPGAGVPDKGLHVFDYPLQMLQKDGDFRQIGELLSVWIHGHEVERPGEEPSGHAPAVRTLTTFAEFMDDDLARLEAAGAAPAEMILVNRLRLGATLGVAETDPGTPQWLHDEMHAVPDLPAGARVLDAFVCDGPGSASAGDPAGAFGNAAGFGGRATPGLVNVNTAPPEVLRSAPHWCAIVHQDPALVDPETFPRVALPEAVVHYRERYGSNTSGVGAGVRGGADWIDRGGDSTGPLRGDRGIAALGELRLVDRTAESDTAGATDGAARVPPDAWRITAAALGPFGAAATGAAISTDVIGGANDPVHGDTVAGDAEEASLLLAGAANMLTTRSDTFTVAFRIRAFRRNPQGRLPSGYVGPVWDATDPAFIVSDERFVMLVDRSDVNRPDDRPRIVYLERVDE